MSLYTQNIENILDQYDADFEHYAAYADRLVVILHELFDRTTIPISSISGAIMSRGQLRDRLLTKGAVYNDLNDFNDLISLKVITYFFDDINFAISIIGRQFVLAEIALTELEEAAQGHFGIMMKRLTLMLPEEKYHQVEYSRFSAMKAELKVRSALQHSWFKVKDVFDAMAAANNIPPTQINQLAQVSYLLKMADAELCRIKSSLSKKRESAAGAESGKEEIQEQPQQPQPAPQHAAAPQIQNTSPVQHDSTEDDQKRLGTFLSELEGFILNDRVVRALDRNIADYFNTRLTYDDDFAETLAKVFINIKLDAINSIKVQLDGNRTTINSLMKHIFGDMAKEELEVVNRGSSLLVLFYVLIAQTGNIEIIKRQIRDFSALEEGSVDEFANDLLFYYRKSV